MASVSPVVSQKRAYVIFLAKTTKYHPIPVANGRGRNPKGASPPAICRMSHLSTA